MTTFTTYNATEAITWQRVGGIARPIKVERDIMAGPVAKSKKPIDPDALCARCGERPRRRYNAIYCAECSEIRAAEVDRESYLRSKKPCPGDCGGLIDRRTAMCCGCRKKRRELVEAWDEHVKEESA